jgi:hypothetical protein
MDNLVFEDSISSEVSQSEFISKKWVYVNDINNGNYSSQIIIDSTPLANAGGYVNWAEGYIAMPLVVSLVGTAGSIGTDANSNLSNHSWAFRNGFWHIINSMSIEFNNQNIVQQTPFLNVFRSFKAHTSFSLDDLQQGYSIGYSPDSAGTWEFDNSAGNKVAGEGLANNRDAPFLQATTTATNATAITQINLSSYAQASNPSNVGAGSQFAYNEGVAKRGEWYCYSPQVASKGQESVMGKDACDAVFRAYKLPRTKTGSDNVASWTVMAKLRLKDLCHYFEKCPLLKGSTMRFLINTNQTTTKFTKAIQTTSATTGVITESTFTDGTVSVSSQGLTNPLMVVSGAIGQGSALLPSGDYTLSVSIYQDTVNNIKGGNNPVRLYAPVYKMNPIAEQRYLSLAPTKRVEYCDIFQYQFSNVGAGESFNFLVSNGIPNIQSVLVIPFITPASNGTSFNTLLSPFTTSGATPDPCPLNNFNILISGVNLFLNNQLYDYEQFLQELSSSNQLNGGLTTGLASGLISESDFSRGMRYYYGNASRMLPSEEGVSRSVQILGVNQSLVAVNLMVFVEFKKSMTIDISTGARID